MRLLTILIALLVLGFPARAADPSDILRDWYRLTLELIRHTPTHSPPVAARSLAYIGVTTWEVAASDQPELTSLAGQLAGLTTLPAPEGELDRAVVLNAALSAVIAENFSHTGPTGQRALQAMARTLRSQAAEGLPPDQVQAAEAYGNALAAHILAWATQDGAKVDNMGFPMTWTTSPEKGHWVPTSKIVLQQAPLLPDWGKNRPFAMPAGTLCDLPVPPVYSEDPASEFYRQAQEVVDTTKALTPEQDAIARFWSDDAMLTTTPPGHWISIAMTVLDQQDADFTKRADVLARLGIVLGDAFIGCWDAKFRYDLVRPVTYIRALIDPSFEPILTTPPFPEYPSGHSVQSGAAAAVLTAIFGDNFAFTDDSHVDDGLPARSFNSFDEAAAEAAISRLFGGIHFRAAIENGIAMGRCIADYSKALKTL